MKLLNESLPYSLVSPHLVTEVGYNKCILLYIGVTSSILIGYKHAANSCLLCFSYVIPTDNRFYICKSDVIPTDNSFMHPEVTSPNTLTSSLISFVMVESKSRFATLSEEDLNLLLDDKDAKNTKRATKSALKVFHQYLKEKSRWTSNERYACERAKSVLCRSSKSRWHFLFKEHIEQPQIWIKSAFQSYSWFWHHYGGPLTP